MGEDLEKSELEKKSVYEESQDGKDLRKLAKDTNETPEKNSRRDSREKWTLVREKRIEEVRGWQLNATANDTVSHRE
jgi:hypothetical protein